MESLFKRVFLTVFLFLTTLSGHLVFANDDDSIGLTFTPRVWYSMMNQNTFSFTEDEKFENVHIPLYGGTVGYRPNNSQWDFLVTVLTGTGDGDYAFSGG